MARGVGDQRSSARRSRGEGASGWGVRVWLRGGEERGHARQGISGHRLVEVGEGVRVGCVGVTAGWRGAGARRAGAQQSSARQGRRRRRREGQSAKG